MQKKSIVAGTSAALIFAGLAAAGPAAADPTFVPNTATDASRDIVGVGSDTTELAMGNAAVAYSAGKSSGRLASFDANKYNADGTQANSKTIVLRSGRTEINRPNGSGAGKALLYGASNNADVDYARSSSALNAAEQSAGLYAYPFAVDSLQMGTAATTNAPATLTEAQIVSIYKGDITNWSQVGGKDGVIVPLIPQSGSGTRSFFEGELKRMNGNVAVALGGNVKTTQEHSDVDVKGNPNAIAPFSAGRARLLGGTVSLKGGWVAKRAVYNVVRNADRSNTNITKIFGSSGYLCSPQAQKAIMDGGLDQMATPPAGGNCGVPTQSAETNFTPAPIVSTAKTVMVTPSRILDTRTGAGAPKRPIGAFATQRIKIAGVGGVPASGVSAVILNVTATGSTKPGYLTVWPSGVAKPSTSNVNFRAGESVPNQVIVKVGADGYVNLSPSVATNVIADVSGYYTSAADLKTFPPQRIHDTRSTKVKVPAGGSINVPVTGRAGVPASGVDSVLLNVTAIGATDVGYLTAYPTGVARPTASNINYVAGDTKAGLVIAKVGSNGMVTIYSSKAVDVAVDISGYYPTGSDYTAMTPVRALDQRPARTADNGVVSLQVRGTRGVPNDAKAVMLNVTATGSSADGAVTVWPSGVKKPLASSVNYTKGKASSNSVMVGIGSDGKVNLSPRMAASLIVDVQGYVR